MLMTLCRATVSESEGIIGLRERYESDFPSLSNSANSCHGLSTSACARASSVACAVALAGVCFGSPSSAMSAAVVHAHATTLYGARNSVACSMGPTGTRRVKGGVSSPAEHVRLVLEVEAGVIFRPAGFVRGKLQVSFLEGNQALVGGPGGGVWTHVPSTGGS